MKRIFGSRWFLSFIGVLLLSLLVVFFLGPLIQSLDSVIMQASVIGALVLTWGLTNFILDHRHSRADRALIEGVTTTSPSEVQSIEEIATLKEQLAKALSLLRRASGSRG